MTTLMFCSFGGGDGGVTVVGGGDGGAVVSDGEDAGGDVVGGGGGNVELRLACVCAKECVHA